MARRRLDQGAEAPNGVEQAVAATEDRIKKVQDEAVARAQGRLPAGAPPDEDLDAVAYPSSPSGTGDALAGLFGPSVPTASRRSEPLPKYEQRIERCPDGSINNCSWKHGEPEKDCQICLGECPDRKKDRDWRIDRHDLASEKSQENEVVAEQTVLRGTAADYVEAALGEEMYGLKNSFSSYRVPAVSGRTSVLPGQTRKEALRSLLDELREVQAEERIKARDAFVAHLPKAFEQA